jgi:dynein heavy chain
LVPTEDTTKFKYILQKNINERGIKRPVLFCGDSGTAKSVIINFFINGLEAEKWMKLTVNFSSRTTSSDL